MSPPGQPGVPWRARPGCADSGVCRVRAASKATALMWVACDFRRSVAPEAAFLSVTQLVLAPLFLKSRKVNLITGG